MLNAHVQLLREVRSLFVVGQAGLSRLSGASRRTVQRWDAGRSQPAPVHFHALARRVHSRDRVLATRLAQAGGTTIQALGLAAADTTRGPRADADVRHVVDSVVCAASEAAGLLPTPMRAALWAACRRARALGLSLEALEGGLATPKPTRAANKPGA